MLNYDYYFKIAKEISLRLLTKTLASFNSQKIFCNSEIVYCLSYTKQRGYHNHPTCTTFEESCRPFISHYISEIKKNCSGNETMFIKINYIVSDIQRKIKQPLLINFKKRIFQQEEKCLCLQQKFACITLVAKF